jgi:hypothetical protein
MVILRRAWKRDSDRRRRSRAADIWVPVPQSTAQGRKRFSNRRETLQSDRQTRAEGARALTRRSDGSLVERHQSLGCEGVRARHRPPSDEALSLDAIHDDPCRNPIAALLLFCLSHYVAANMRPELCTGASPLPSPTIVIRLVTGSEPVAMAL